MRAVAYTRISADLTGRGLGVARQLEDVQKLAQQLGWTIVETHSDNDISAYSGKRRPGFEAMLDAMANGRVDAIVCWHTDRLYRNMKDLERVIELADQHHVEIRTVQGGTLDLSTSAGRMVARILGSVARQESEHGSERRRRANAQRAAAGEWSSSRRVFGYDRHGEPLEPEAAAVRRAAADLLAGKSVKQITREWNEAGLSTTGSAREWRATMLKRVLMNPRYAGLVVHQGKVVGKGTWQCLIDEDTHRGVVAVFSDPARRIGTGFERKYQGSGVYRCGVCGGVLKGWQPSKTGGNGRAYVCINNSHVRRQGQALDEYITSIVLGRLHQPDAVRLASALINPAADVGALHTQKLALQARLDELAGLFAEGAINASQLKKASAELTNAVNACDRELAESAIGSPLADLLTPVRYEGEMEKRWMGLSADVRGKIINQLMTVSVNPSPRGLRRFDPEYVDVTWTRHDAI